MRNQLRDRSVMAVLTSQTMFPGVLTAIRVIQNSVVKENIPRIDLRTGSHGLPDERLQTYLRTINGCDSGQD